jgi:DNA-binding response OmpR family regulator
VDDEEKIVDVVKSYLELAGYKVVSAYNGADAMELFDRHSPALVVLDLMLPDISGENVCRAIRRKSRTPVIMLTAKSAEESVLRGLEIGADDYVVKPFSPRQLAARVAAVLRRVTVEPLPVAAELVFDGGRLVVDSVRHEVRKDGAAVALTPSEFKLVMTMAQHPTRAFSREEMIAFAFGDEFEGYDRVVDTHIKNIRQKLEDDPKAPRHILTVHGVGYKFGGGENENQP